MNRMEESGCRVRRGFLNAICSGALATLATASAWGGVCPSAGSCFEAHLTTGCDDAACCTTVCADDPFCCESEWDSICVEGAIELCACANADGGCLVEHATTGCTDPICCQVVCEDDIFCCDTEWDSICVDEAEEFCATCGGAAAGSCFEEHALPACNDTECCELVCADDPFCCDTEWDGICVDEAFEFCAGCGDPASGSCLEQHPNTGCDNLECCLVVCNDDLFCCESEWDSICVDEAAEFCATCGGEGAGNCFEEHDLPACDDAECCAIVCADDPFCCESEWDEICVDEAAEFCGGCGPGAGSCLEAHPNTGCEDLECCATVCAEDPFCCESEWDDVCVDEANELCIVCGADNTGSCFEVHANPACDDAECCAIVCAEDPFCCESEWDEICVDEALELCGGCDPDCQANLNGDKGDLVNAADLAILLGAWSIPADAPGCGGDTPCCADLTGDGFVNAADLAILLGAWSIPAGAPGCGGA